MMSMILKIVSNVYFSDRSKHPFGVSPSPKSLGPLKLATFLDVWLFTMHVKIHTSWTSELAVTNCVYRQWFSVFLSPLNNLLKYNLVHFNAVLPKECAFIVGVLSWPLHAEISPDSEKRLMILWWNFLLLYIEKCCS